MVDLKFCIVDVFAVDKYTGNQLAVFLEAGKLSTNQMQQLAKEMNYSETAFILASRPQDEGYNVRIFTPEQELPFAGHPVLGTACVIGQEVIGEFPETVNLNLQVGQIPVTRHLAGEEEFFWMRQASPNFGQHCSAQALAEILRLEAEEIDDKFPVQEVSTGVPFIIVPLKNLASLKRIKVNRDRCFELVETLQAKSILVFCPETYQSENDLNVRMFADYLGVPEDPATGSANGCLAAYLVEHAYFGQETIDIRVEQGYEIKRPSLLLLKAQKRNSQIEVEVGGKVIMVAKGELV